MNVSIGGIVPKANTNSAVGLAVTKVGMENMKQDAAETVEMMKNMTKQQEKAVNPYLGGSIDIKV